MRRMYSEAQLIALIQQYAQGGDLSVFAPTYSDESTYAQGDIISKDNKFYQAKADISTAEEWNAEHWNEVTFEEALKPYLNDKFVKIMDAPSSTTLSAEQIKIIEEGIHIKGRFLDFVNPILFPCTRVMTGQRTGFIMGDTFGGDLDVSSTLGIYRISNNTISFYKSIFTYRRDSNRTLFLGKDIPEYPANTGTFTLKCVDGVLTWVADA